MPRKEEPKEILGLNRITKKRLLELCKKDKLYQTPELNDVLYLHYQGFESIECLEDYTELKCLWLECNAISEIQGLEKLTKLKCLFLQSNLIRKIENLEFCKELDTVNLSQNHIRKIENCGSEVLPVLNTLNLSSNYLKDCDALKELENCTNLSVLDLSNNRIDDILVVKIFARMPELKVLVLQGNPVVSKIPQYRKTLILECKKLTYLDSRPVFPKDRACAEAWKRGGYEEERRENGRWNRKERKKMRDGVNATIQLRNKHRKLEDQISLIPSSDSEDDLNMRKEQLQTPIVSDVNVDAIWNEVSEVISTEESLISNMCLDNTKTSEMNCSFTDENDTLRTIENEQNSKEVETKSYNERDLIPLEGNSNKIFNTYNEGDINTHLMQNRGKPLEIGEDKEQKFEIGNISSNIHQNNSHDRTDSNTNSEDKYQPVVEAIEMISKSLNYPPKEVQLCIDDVTKEESFEDNYEPLKELDEKMEIFSKQEFEEQPSNRKAVKIETLQGVEKEEETFRLNQQLRNNLEELSNNMSDFIKQLGEDQELREDFIKNVSDENIAAKESSCESSEADSKDGLEECKLDGVIDSWDKVTGVIKDHEIISNEINLNKSLSHDSTECKSNYIPMDISQLTRQSNEALDSLERESNYLKKLLQELENKNEELPKVQDSGVCYKDKNIEGNIFEKENQGGHSRDSECNKNIQILDYEIPQYHEKIVQEIIDEILQSLQHDSSDCNEELELPAASIKHKMQIASESVPEFLGSFNSFFNDVKLNNLTKDKDDFIDNINKSAILKDLAKQPYIKQFNNDTLETLDAQIEQIKIERNTKVRSMIDRVYAQKDRYNDTLELVDGKLMVRNKDTNELRELPQPRQYESSNSEDDYDTADDQSEDDEKFNENKKEQNTNLNVKPTDRKYCEDIVIKSLILNQNNESDDGESNDEFYSLDTEVTSNLVNIDKEFLNNLTLTNVNLTQNEEQHIVQCARSYEVIKHLTVSQEEISLTKEENDLLENMMKNKCDKSKEYIGDSLKSLQFKTNLNKQQHLESEDIKGDTEVFNLVLTSSDVAIPLFEYKHDKNMEKETSEREIATKGNRLIHRDGSGKEKNEIENNIDLGSKKLENQKTRESTKDVLENSAKGSNIPEITINAAEKDNSADHSTLSDVEILECNLQIIEINDEILDSVTVNAELQI